MGRFIAAACWPIAACGKAGSLPTAASSPPPASRSERCASPPYTISGVISTYRSEPLNGAMVEVDPYPFGYGMDATTDVRGAYSVCGPNGQGIGVQVYRSGYATAFKYALSARDQTVNLALRPAFEVPVAGGTVGGVIDGDEFEAGDDEFGGLCTRVPCKMVDFTYLGCPDTCSNRGAQIILQWAEPATHLALYFSNADGYFAPPSVPPGTRYCCTSPVIASYTFDADFDRFAIGFEDIDGHLPHAADRATFELVLRPLP